MLRVWKRELYLFCAGCSESQVIKGTKYDQFCHSIPNSGGTQYSNTTRNIIRSIKIYGQRLVEHQLIQDGVAGTFDNGISIMVNYNPLPVELERDHSAQGCCLLEEDR